MAGRQLLSTRIKVLVFMILAAFVASLTVVSNSPAEAYCYGEGVRQSASWGIHGTESYQSSESCNDDGSYYGKYRDSSTPNGSCMWIKYVDDNVYKTTSSNCGTTYKNYSYWDSNHQSSTWICDAYGCMSPGLNNHEF